ncbi:XK-related protein 7 isoform X1 [Neodiprion lecontei]|uniref:XK-related protein n=1 Tax=Neodiprion lecontei TaxID=441921 RepID=A0A6J0BYZ8_NEOLC|nr:XK-related protein 7 isoform X1 [Neodiprion lecontei]
MSDKQIGMDLQKAIKTDVLRAVTTDVQQQLETNVQQQFKIDEQKDLDNSVKFNMTGMTMNTDGNNNESESTVNLTVVDPQNACDESNPLAPRKKPDNARSNDNAVDETPSVSNFTLACNAGSIVSYFIFLTGNIRLVIEYWTSDKKEHLIFMIVLLILTSAIIAGVSAKMQYYEVETSTTEVENLRKKRNRLDKLANLKVPFWLAVLFQLDVLLRCVRRLCHGLAVRMYGAKGNLEKQYGWYDAMLKDNADLALLDLIRSFVASAPQLILQLTLFFDQGLDSVPLWKIFTWSITVICLGLAMETYHCAVRLPQPDKRRITKPGEVFMSLWYCCTIGARILLIAITASKWPSYTLLGCTVNWLGWTTWIYVQKNGVLNFCRDRTKSEPTEPTRLELLGTFLFSAVIAVVYMFTAVILKDGSTFLRYCFYYGLMTLQNGAMLILFIYFSSTPVENYLILDASCILAMTLFFIGIAAMMMYYLFFQPTVKITYVTCSPV